MASTASTDKFITVRLKADLHDRFLALAENSERTLAAEVRLAMRRHLAASLGEPPVVEAGRLTERDEVSA